MDSIALKNGYLPDEPIPDSWGVSHMRVSTVKYLWHISNFSFWDSQYIDSPIFSSKETSHIKWSLRFYPQESRTLDLILESWKIGSVKAKCQFSILNDQGEKCATNPLSDFHVFNWFYRRSISDLFPGRNILLDRYLFNDTLAILCEIKLCMGRAYQLSPSTVSAKSASLGSANQAESPSNLEVLLTSGRLSDVTIHCAGTKILAHRCVLAAGSPVFAAMFEHQAASCSVEVEDIGPEAIRQFLRFVYSGHFGDDGSVVELLFAANKYQIESLKHRCAEALCEKLNANNAEEMVTLAELYKLEGLRTRSVNLLAMRGRDPTMGRELQEFRDKPDRRARHKIARGFCESLGRVFKRREN